MDAEDKARTLSNKAKLLLALQYRRVMTNEEVRRISGSRGMARCHELIQEGHPITVRKLRGAIWQVTYHADPPSIAQRSLF